MKTLSSLCLTLLCLTLITPCSAQRRAGFYSGVNFSSMRFDPEEGANNQSRFVIGGFGSRQIGRGVALQYGLQFISKGAELTDGYDAIDVKLNYVETNLSLQAGIIEDNGGIYLIGGVGIGLLASARGQIPGANEDIRELFSSGDLSYQGGLCLRIKGFFVEGLYHSSLISVLKEDSYFSGEAFNQGIQLRFGLSFGLY